MVNVDEIYGSGDGPQFLNAKLFKEQKLGNTDFDIVETEIKTFDKDDGSTEKKLAINFDTIDVQGENKNFQLVLNKTNADILKEEYGLDSDDWIGHRIRIMLVKRKYQGKLVDGMQVVPQSEGESGGEATPAAPTVEKPKTNTENLEENGAKVMQVGPTDEEINRMADQQIQKANGNWFKIIEEYLPDNKEDLEDPEKRAAEFINRIRQDLIGQGVRKENISVKVIRDNVAVLVREGSLKEQDLGVLDDNAGGQIFKLLRKVDPV